VDRERKKGRFVFNGTSGDSMWNLKNSPQTWTKESGIRGGGHILEPSPRKSTRENVKKKKGEKTVLGNLLNLQTEMVGRRTVARALEYGNWGMGGER